MLNKTLSIALNINRTPTRTNAPPVKVDTNSSTMVPNATKSADSFPTVQTSTTLSSALPVTLVISYRTTFVSRSSLKIAKPIPMIPEMSARPA